MSMPEIDNKPVPMTEHVALAVLTSEVRHIKEAVDRIESAASQNVPRTSWEQRNIFVDEKFIQVNKDIKDLETDTNKAIGEIWTELKAKRLPWTSIAAFIVAAALAFFEILDRVGVSQ